MTTKAEWLKYARDSKDKLVSLINNYHPASANQIKKETRELLVYSAPGAEMACEVVRDKIRAEWGVQGSPVYRFNEALEAGDVGTLSTLLNQTWFGVPETQGCWHLEGFNEAVELLEDPPESEI